MFLFSKIIKTFNFRRDNVEKAKANDGSDSDDQPLSKLSKTKKLKRSHKERYKIVQQTVPKLGPEYTKKEENDCSRTVKWMRYNRSIEQCDEGNCSYSDHYPEGSASVTPDTTGNQVVNNEEYSTTSSAGPSTELMFQPKLEKDEQLQTTESCSSD